MVAVQRVSLVVVLAAVLCTLVPLAYASPPDQTWQSGIYDEADFDDVVTILATTQIIPAPAPAEPLFVQIVIAMSHGAVSDQLTPPVRPASTRAPPALRPIV